MSDEFPDETLTEALLALFDKALAGRRLPADDEAKLQAALARVFDLEMGAADGGGKERDRGLSSV